MELRARAEERVGEGRAGGYDMLTVVENEQGTLLLQPCDEGHRDVLPGLFTYAKS